MLYNFKTMGVNAKVINDKDVRVTANQNIRDTPDGVVDDDDVLVVPYDPVIHGDFDDEYDSDDEYDFDAVNISVVPYDPVIHGDFDDSVADDDVADDDSATDYDSYDDDFDDFYDNRFDDVYDEDTLVDDTELRNQERADKARYLFNQSRLLGI